MNQYVIKHVAIYLRKSRGDEEKDLEKHRLELVSMCEQNDWAYVEYAEVGTSDSLSVRPKMQELMQDIEQGMYDAVVAIHIDRLSRGDEVDRATISKLLAKSETLLVTPQRVYDYNNDTDMLMAEFEGMMARMEYKQISRRFRQGKARNAKQGLWSNGVPPFPYVRNPLTGKAEPNEENLPIYRFMIEKCLSGWSNTDIAWELNKMGIKSPRDRMWNPSIVRRLLVDEVHLGKIIVGKKRKISATGDLVIKPKEEWIVYNNCHKPVKTQLEHDKIAFIMTVQSKKPKASRSGKNPFSGLVTCGVCGRTLTIQKRTGREYDTLRSCTYRDHFGERCVNLGDRSDVLKRAVVEAIKLKKKQIEKAIKDGLSSSELSNLSEIANLKLQEIREQERAIERIYDFFERGKYTEKIFDERLSRANETLEKLEEEYSIIKTTLDNSLSTKNEDMLVSVNEVLECIESETDSKELNRAYKSIINKITWTKLDFDSDPTVYVNFL
ncbi:recombinase family protein [Paenibacillus spiritus]|uniref:Recombinase family protein n=1 Tax=Paenibacillus spiritus TaxID=2496557 RepID=A0A5J5GG73_9BACL|nr:recombinase family protein [Paenibacillus spiritus]KAA9007206.1 recombinase family protein [Paenibacillus spiritus]